MMEEEGQEKYFCIHSVLVFRQISIKNKVKISFKPIILNLRESIFFHIEYRAVPIDSMNQKIYIIIKYNNDEIFNKNHLLKKKKYYTHQRMLSSKPCKFRTKNFFV